MTDGKGMGISVNAENIPRRPPRVGEMTCSNTALWVMRVFAGSRRPYIIFHHPSATSGLRSHLSIPRAGLSPTYYNPNHTRRAPPPNYKCSAPAHSAVPTIPDRRQWRDVTSGCARISRMAGQVCACSHPSE